jgi:GNAT superfamily N-acetyltransferase
MDTLVRRAALEDAEAIAAVHTRTWQVAYRGSIPDHYLDQLDQHLERRIQSWRNWISTESKNGHEVWVSDAVGHVDGFAHLGPARDSGPEATGELYAIYVDPIRWNQGVGRALFTQATNRLISAGYSAAILWVLESNVRARRFYEVAGWTFDGGTKQESRPDGVELLEVRYRVRLHREEEE